MSEATRDPSAPIRWGILAPGHIAHAFARDLPKAENARLVAVASRNRGRAEAFGKQYGVSPERCYEGYEHLASDPDIDAVYVATPHPLHFEDSRMLLAAGKAVLCEKPLTLNVAQAQTLVELARARRAPLVEAMWTRWLPATRTLRELLRAGVIGEPRMLRADFGFRADYDPESRLFKPELGGGALLDVGVYVVSFASMIFGEPDTVQAVGTLAPSGVDEQVGLLLGHEGGAVAVLSCANRTATDHNAYLYGTEGFIKVGPHFFHARQLTICQPGQPEEVLDLPFEGGYQFEADEVGRLLRSGELESPELPWAESVAVMRTLDRARAQLGVRYPSEGGAA